MLKMWKFNQIPLWMMAVGITFGLSVAGCGGGGAVPDAENDVAADAVLPDHGQVDALDDSGLADVPNDSGRDDGTSDTGLIPNDQINDDSAGDPGLIDASDDPGQHDIPADDISGDDAIAGDTAIDDVTTDSGVDAVCVPDCGDRVCGLDPICSTQECGECDTGYSCVEGKCELCGEDGMCFVPAGSFWMGCNTELDTDCSPSESPYHEVTLSGFFIDRTEVTAGEYYKCFHAGACEIVNALGCVAMLGSETHPRNCVSWDDASAYCSWVGKRLPTEAEWEKAARGTDGRVYPWGNETVTCDRAVMLSDEVEGCGTGNVWPVCSKSPAGDSPYGLCDMSGNVWEWVSDWYSDTYYEESPASNPTGPATSHIRALRGGGLGHDAKSQRASSRNFDDPGAKVSRIGFRCAKDLQ